MKHLQHHGLHFVPGQMNELAQNAKALKKKKWLIEPVYTTVTVEFAPTGHLIDRNDTDHTRWLKDQKAMNYLNEFDTETPYESIMYSLQNDYEEHRDFQIGLGNNSWPSYKNLDFFYYVRFMVHELTRYRSTNPKPEGKVWFSESLSGTTSKQLALGNVDNIPAGSLEVGDKIGVTIGSRTEFSARPISSPVPDMFLPKPKEWMEAFKRITEMTNRVFPALSAQLVLKDEVDDSEWKVDINSVVGQEWLKSWDGDELNKTLLQAEGIPTGMTTIAGLLDSPIRGVKEPTNENSLSSFYDTEMSIDKEYIASLQEQMKTQMEARPDWRIDQSMVDKYKEAIAAFHQLPDMKIAQEVIKEAVAERKVMKKRYLQQSWSSRRNINALYGQMGGSGLPAVRDPDTRSFFSETVQSFHAKDSFLAKLHREASLRFVRNGMFGAYGDIPASDYYAVLDQAKITDQEVDFEIYLKKTEVGDRKYNLEMTHLKRRATIYTCFTGAKDSLFKKATPWIPWPDIVSEPGYFEPTLHLHDNTVTPDKDMSPEESLSEIPRGFVPIQWIDSLGAFVDTPEAWKGSPEKAEEPLKAEGVDPGKATASTGMEISRAVPRVVKKRTGPVLPSGYKGRGNYFIGKDNLTLKQYVFQETGVNIDDYIVQSDVDSWIFNVHNMPSDAIRSMNVWHNWKAEDTIRKVMGD